MLALGLAPPSDEPGANKIDSHLLISNSSWLDSRTLIPCCSSLIDDQGGVGNFDYRLRMDHLYLT